MGHRLHNAVVHPEGAADDFLPVAGHRPGGDADIRAQLIKLPQKFPDKGDGVAGVLLVFGIEQPPLLVGDHRFDGGGACVDAHVHRAGLLLQPPAGDGVAPVALGEGQMLLLGGKKRGDDGVFRRPLVTGQLFDGLRKGNLLLPAPGGPQGYVIEGVFRAEAGEAQGLIKALPQAGEEGEGSPQVKDLPLDAPPLGKPRDGLVHHRPEDAGGHVLLLGPLV